MNLVLGVTVGASAVRLARPGTPDHRGPVFRSRAVDRGRDVPEEIAAEATKVALAENVGVGSHTVVAYRDQAQAGALQAAFEQKGIGNFELIPEVTATLRMLEEPGALTDQSTLVVVDMGSSGSTISVVDRHSRSTVVTARSTRISGDHFDDLVYSDQTVRRRISTPADPGGDSELQSRCRLAKEQLSTRSAVCLPGPGGLLLLSREVFDSLVITSVEAFAREIREVIATSGRNPDAIVLIGGGARIPIVRATLAAWLDCPVIAPEQPELVAAQGAALIAESSLAPSSRPVAAPVQAPAVAPIFAPYPIHTPAEVPVPVQAFSHGGVATLPESERPEVAAETKSVPQEQMSSPYAADLPQPRPNRHEQRFDPAADLAVAVSDPATDGFGTERDADTEAVMVDAQAYSAVREDEGVGAGTAHPSWLAGTQTAETTSTEPRNPLRFAGLGAGVIAAVVIVGLGLGYGGKVFGDSDEAGPVATEVTTTAPTTTTTPPPPPTTTPQLRALHGPHRR
ncbi:Hsp70 family protein, partial [Rhodococcus sp. (in: high G+C Gram-positive bacteria)]|uniref:Hsp70 family protein n=1 Tax=Rhodococcus sp. TaxID=1831 RepID=UPI0025FF69A0